MLRPRQLGVRVSVAGVRPRKPGSQGQGGWDLNQLRQRIGEGMTEN